MCLGLAIASIWIVIVAACLWRPRLVSEDGAVENFSAAGFFVAAFLFSAIVVLGRSELPTRRSALLAGLSAFCLLLFLSEVSFGARAIGTPVLDMYGGGEFDGGHDLVILTYRLLKSAGIWGALVAALLFGGLAIAVRLAFRRHRAAFSRAASLVREEPLIAKLAAALVLLGCAVLLDLGSGRFLAVLEETTELLASGLMLVAALHELQGRYAAQGRGNAVCPPR